ncbi:MAG: DUF3097 family protein [Schaalia hyovaginalis]|uniref:DUF3097 family protein n=1 Tax=Schaalia hyovaginalis TaxID=29316 RepID=UPI0023F9B636|nr:DUF3097 family protein [Schaalia hyovaginalis]MCI7670782.1 DUF3097 domain-containing protein [Schaalia hyovaginalis]MDY5506488.1 DUF3097 family protein [Schaalia hyovaginalis]
MSLPNPNDPYGTDVLSVDPHREGPGARRPRSTEVRLEMGMVLEDVTTGWVGAVVGIEKSGGIHLVELEDRHGRTRSFPLGAGFWLEGRPIIALPPLPSSARRAPSLATPAGRRLTNSGSIAAPKARARVARASRIWVEGKHDAELVQHVWGDDLAEAGVAVQLLEGVDNLEEILEVFSPSDDVRAGILVDHLVPGSKESRIAERVMKRWGSCVLVLGHPYVDVWQAVKPARLGLEKWPEVPRGTDIKTGTLRALGWPARTQADIAMGWKRILAAVGDYRDLEPALLGRVEALIDFVTEPGTR